MLRRCALFVVIASLFLSAPATVAGQEDGSLEGVWVLEEVRSGSQVDSTPLPGMFFFSDGYMAFVDIQASSGRTFEESGAPTRAEKAAAYEGFAGLAGQYEIRGDTLFLRPYVALHPDRMRGWPEYSHPYGTVRLEGERATFDLIGNPLVVTFRRVSEEAPLSR